MRQQVLARYEAGESSRRIATELGLAKSTALKIVGEAGGLRPTNKILSDAQVEVARALREEGWLYREIGKRFGVHKDTIRKRILGS